MGTQVTVKCPKCREQWTVERNYKGEWVNAKSCPKCGFEVLKRFKAQKGE